MDTLTALDWTIWIGYLVAVFGIGLWFARGQKGTDDYFVGGRRMHWLPVGLSVFAGTFSSLSFVGLPADAAYGDYHLLLGILCIPFVVTPVIWIVFMPVFFRFRMTSVYEYVEWRFDRPLRLVASVLFLFYTVGWMGNLLRAVGVILQAVMDLDHTQTAWLLVGVGLFATFYTTVGGVKAVVWTDALQAVSLGGGMVAVLWLTTGQVDGGWNEVVDVARRDGKFDMFHTRFSLHRENLWGALAFGIFVYLAGHSVNFTAVQRYVSMPDIRAARVSLIVNGVMVGVVCLVFFLVGTAVYVFYQQSGVTPNLFAEMEAADTKDQLLPRFLIAELPLAGLMGLLLAGLFAAAMSSVDSGINSMTASIVCDWLPGPETQLNLRLSRILCGTFGVLATGLSIVIYFVGGDVFPLIMKIAGLFLGLILGVVALGLFVRRANAAGATLGLVCGVAAGLAAMYYDVASYWYGAFTTVPTFVVGWVGSFAFPAPPEEKVQGLLAFDDRPHRAEAT